MQVGKLVVHPEGGTFREVYRSASNVRKDDGQQRSSLTHIYFHLDDGEFSRFHRVESDEVWNLYQGKGVVLYIWDEAGQSLSEVVLAQERQSFCAVVEAGKWQAARPLDGPVLVGCTVAPGFEFEDFMLVQPDCETARRILMASPDLADLVAGKKL